MANDSSLLQQHRERALLLHRLKWLALLVVILVGVGLAAKPAYRIFRDYRINKNLQAAQEAARLEDWTTARDKARSVLLVRRDDLPAFRIWCRALAEQKEPKAYMAAWYRFCDRRCTEHDRLEALRVLAFQAPEAVASRAYNSLPKEKRQSAEIVAAITPLFVRMGEAATSEKLLRASMGETPSAEVSLEFIRAICKSGDQVALDEARNQFSRLVASDSSREALEALELLGDIPGGLAPSASLPADLPEWVKQQPKSRTIHHLLALHPAIETAPDTASALFRQAIEQFCSLDPGVLGTWLVRHNRSEEALLVLEIPSKTRADAFIARLHALLRLGRDEEMSHLIEEAPPAADMVEVAILRAIVAKRLGQNSVASISWKKALDEAAYDTKMNRFIEVAHAAELHGEKEVCEDSWVAAIRSGWGPLPRYQIFQPLAVSLAQKGRSEDLLAIFRSMMDFESENPEVLHNYLYLALIHHVVPPADVVSRLRQMTKDYPNNSAVVASLILAEMMNDQSTDALAHIPGIRDSKVVGSEMKKILEATSLILTGNSQAGTKLLSNVDWDGTMLQERRVFRELLARRTDLVLPPPLVAAVQDRGDPEKVPAWRKAIEKMERDRAGEILPPLPMPEVSHSSGDLPPKEFYLLPR